MFASSGVALEVLAERVRPTAASRTRLLPVAAPFVPLFPDGGLRRGAVLQCSGTGARSLALALTAEASAAGSWCALVGAGDLGALAAAEHGVDLSRLAVVRTAAAEWAMAVGGLLDGVDVVVLEPPAHTRAIAARQLVARARRSGAVLLLVGDPSRWSGGADMHLRADGARWRGLDRGAGRLRARRVRVVAHGRGAAGRAVERELWLPAATGSAAEV